VVRVKLHIRLISALDRDPIRSGGLILFSRVRPIRTYAPNRRVDELKVADDRNEETDRQRERERERERERKL
jgi:hypothetical protein